MSDLNKLFIALRDACEKYFPEEEVDADTENRLQCAFDSPPTTSRAYSREIVFLAGELQRWFPTNVAEDQALYLNSLIDDARVLPFLRSAKP